ncbi:MAG: DUF481 domain-containing protein [Cyclobacteriaceae bacterium]|nr:DUF481 domain-containing protein [Cyclobacteriaceae bacterium]
MISRKLLIFSIYTIALLFSFPVLSQKTDRVLLDNNDWITGEIKKMDYGKISFKTDAAGTIQIKWDRIYQIKSDKYFEIGLGRGVMYYGSLDVTEDDEKYKIMVITEEEELEIDMNRIVEITPIKNKFWGKIDGNIDIGYSYTKGSDVKQWNSSFRLDYRPANAITTISANSIFTEQPERDATTKQDISLSYKYLMKNNLAYTGFTAMQQNSELGIRLRSSLGVGLSKNWFRSNMQRFITTLGVIVNRENSSDDTQGSTNFEGLVRMEYRVFRYRDPEVDVTSYIDFYPSFTIKDRYRTDLDIKVKFEVFNDFYIGFTFYHNLDTKPPESAASKSDWGINSSIGYSF